MAVITIRTAHKSVVTFDTNIFILTSPGLSSLCPDRCCLYSIRRSCMISVYPDPMNKSTESAKIHSFLKVMLHCSQNHANTAIFCRIPRTRSHRIDGEVLDKYRRLRYNNTVHKRKCSSVGQSARFTSVRSRVRAPSFPPEARRLRAFFISS